MEKAVKKLILPIIFTGCYMNDMTCQRHQSSLNSRGILTSPSPHVSEIINQPLLLRPKLDLVGIDPPKGGHPLIKDEEKVSTRVFCRSKVSGNREQSTTAPTRSSHHSFSFISFGKVRGKAERTESGCRKEKEKKLPDLPANFFKISDAESRGIAAPIAAGF